MSEPQTEENQATDPSGPEDTDTVPENDELTKPEPMLPAGPIQVEEVDRLKAENLNLKLLACVNRETILQQQLNELGKERQAYNEQMQIMQAEIEAKYGINLRTHTIQSDSGMVVPRNPQPGMDPRMAAMLQQQLQQQLQKKG